jgi:hypothetical protein
MNVWLPEQLKTIMNLCDIGLILIGLGRNSLLPTILETMLEQAQQIVDEECIVRDSEEEEENIE